MSSRFFVSFFLVFFLGSLCVGLSSCSMQRRYEKQAMRKQAEVDKKRAEKEAERTVEYEAALQQHYDMQTPEVRRQMKRNYKKAERLNSNKKDVLVVRWYRALFPERVKTKRRRINK